MDAHQANLIKVKQQLEQLHQKGQPEQVPLEQWRHLKHTLEKTLEHWSFNIGIVEPPQDP